MDSHAEKIWQRGSARQIMEEARRRFRMDKWQDLTGAHVALASAHYSLVKRYLGSWWQRPLAAWHMWRAVLHAKKAHVLSGRTREGMLKANLADVVTRIYTVAPSWLGGDPRTAERLLEFTLDSRYPEADFMKPHARALMLITLGDLKWRQGSTVAWEHYDKARELIPAIEAEDSPDREKQLVRVMSAVGFFYYDHGHEELREEGEELINEAANLAGRHSADQFLKIGSEWAKRQSRAK